MEEFFVRYLNISCGYPAKAFLRSTYNLCFYEGMVEICQLSQKIPTCYFISYLTFSLRFTFEALKSLTTGSSFEEFLNVTITAEYEERLRQITQPPPVEPAVMGETLDDPHLEEETSYVGDL